MEGVQGHVGTEADVPDWMGEASGRPGAAWGKLPNNPSLPPSPPKNPVPYVSHPHPTTLQVHSQAPAQQFTSLSLSSSVTPTPPSLCTASEGWGKCGSVL
ncbi:hypothetical protein KIL84_017336 [Mauremys mutica]|uniref:Uncharacterized protein n=1 Tax=Mauremys mutica TaxID=74926 RepID=A0A9D3X4N0_9SAUR|nr:hypothetical protein KIL84_017336 [Mauremys mutica]